MSNHEHHHHHGLAQDLEALDRQQLERRRVLRWAAGLGLLPFVGSALASACGDSGLDTGTDSGASTGTDSGTTTGGSCARIPEETAGPYPGDGSNGPNVLTQSGIVRSDIRSSFGSSSGLAAGIPLTVTLTILSSNGSCAPLAGYAVYIWHCDQQGRYSLYSSGVTDQNYLRGVQSTDADGKVSFTTIFPACYSGRWPHIHFEVYPNLTSATAAGAKIATSQLALPQAVCNDVYATSGYAASVSNLQQVSLATDNVFSDGASAETPTVTGSVSAGYLAALTVGVAV